MANLFQFAAERSEVLHVAMTSDSVGWFQIGLERFHLKITSTADSIHVRCCFIGNRDNMIIFVLYCSYRVANYGNGVASFNFVLCRCFFNTMLPVFVIIISGEKIHCPAWHIWHHMPFLLIPCLLNLYASVSLLPVSSLWNIDTDSTWIQYWCCLVLLVEYALR